MAGFSATNFFLEHKIPLIVAGSVLGTIVLILIIDAAAGVFAPPAPALPAFAEKFSITSITDAAGAAVADLANAVGSYTRIIDAGEEYGNLGETIVAAWRNDDDAHAYYVTYSKVTDTSKYVRHIVKKGNSGLYDEHAKSAPEDLGTNVPLNGAGVWASTGSSAPARFVAFAAVSPIVTLRRLLAGPPPQPRAPAARAAPPQPRMRTLRTARLHPVRVV